MNESNVPPAGGTPPSGDAPPSDNVPPSGGTPPPGGTPAGGSGPGGSGGGSSNRTVMLVLSYLGILALVPLLVETDDEEVQWHAKHGLILLGAWIVLAVVLGILTSIPAIGWLLGCAVMPFLWIAVLVIHIVAIVKALNGDRLVLPVVTELVDRWE